MGTTNIETWSERAKVSIAVEGGVECAFEALTETIDADIGEKGIETIKTTKGGRLVKYNPQEDTTITFEAYPIEAGTSAKASGGAGFFDLMNSNYASTQPQVIPADFNRDRYRCSILWSPSTAAAAAAVTGGLKAMRIVGCGFFTSAKPSFTDGVVKFTVTMFCPVFNKSAVANVKVESTDGSADLPALAAFTSSTNW